MATRKTIKEGTQDGMLHFVSQQLPSGTIGAHSDFSKYKDLDAIRAMMVKKLQKKDMPYSLGALVKLIKDTSKEYKSTTESVQMDASVKEHFNKKVRQKVFERLAEIETTGSVKFDKSDDTNFDVTHSGQPDLEEHHEEYPAEILGMTVGDFLNSAKEKDEELYHGIESMIDKYVGNESVVAESTPSKLDLLKKQSKDFPSFVKAVKAEFPTMVMDRTAIKWLKDDWDETNESVIKKVIEATDGGDNEKKHKEVESALSKIKGIQKLRAEFENPNKYGTILSSFRFDIPTKKGYTLTGELKIDHERDQIFIPQDGYKILKGLKVNDILSAVKNYYMKKNESINEEVRFNIYKIAPDLIPMSARSNNKLYIDMVDALNAVYKKHNVAITISK